MCQNVIALAEERLNSHKEALALVMRRKTTQKAADQYCQSFPDVTTSATALASFLTDLGGDINTARHALLSHSNIYLPHIFTFTLDEFVHAYGTGVDPQQLQQVLDGWTLSFGSLASENAEHFFLGNPIWHKPLICRGQSVYFWPILGLFQSFALRLMENTIRNMPHLWARYEKRRGSFLEDQVERLFQRAFPMAHVYAGSKWGDNYENDLLVVVDSYLIVVEAKAGKVTEIARRGAPDSLKRTVKDLLVEASQQGERFAAYLEAHPGHHTFQTKRGVVNEVDTSNVHHVVRLNVILEPIGDLTAHWPDLLRAGFIQAGVTPAPTLTLADLELAFDVLDGPCQKLHYLVRRAEFEVHAEYFADEMDLLALYLDTGFNIGESEFDGSPLWLYGFSQRIDAYFLAQGTGQRVAKPRLRLTTWWGELVRQRERRRISRWSELGYALHNVAYTDQIEFERAFRQLQTRVRKSSELTAAETVVLSNGPRQRRDAIVGLAYKRVTRDQRNEIMSMEASDACAKTASQWAVVIGQDVKQADYPSSVIAYFSDRVEDASSSQVDTAEQAAVQSE